MARRAIATRTLASLEPLLTLVKRGNLSGVCWRRKEGVLGIVEEAKKSLK